ncbi:MAG: tRNA (N(6)-L-threonylcarbamoyladenosine(37)-C(2))-methylthiotransferase MtaB [Deltaproteobacteria bacterium]|nr:tRNA (N(6)-L-threonylcarbamoyladenosine(37)-C(2))-methylthiotransferase MtaB [Deltaproteobacteria bacterium]
MNKVGKKPSFSIITLGCKVNQFESETIAQELKQSGFQRIGKIRSPDGGGTDTCIINTCTVTHKASMQSRQAIRQAIRSNPNATIIVTGCLAQTDPDDIRQIRGVHRIVEHAEKHRIPEIIQSTDLPRMASSTAEKSFQPNPSEKSVFSPFGNRTRPFLKIQDGCDTFCTYCIVPYARGRHRSMPFEDVPASVRIIQEAGFHEVVLTGIHLGCYGTDLSPATHLTELLTALRDQKAIDRIRLSSIEPLEITDELITLVSESSTRPGHICRHFHIPMQNGDDTILKRMHRPYGQIDFRKRIETIHRTLPEAAIGADVMIGFPGETDKAYQNTLSFIKSLPLSYLHVFPFSPRKGTPAYEFPDRVPLDIVKDRCREIRELGNRKRLDFLEKHIHTKVEVLVETTPDIKTGRLKGVTSNYIKVLLDKHEGIKNTFQNVRIEGIRDSQSVVGRVLS